MFRHFLVVWILSMATASPPVWAQTAPRSAKPDPQDAQAFVPRIIYRSTLANYRGFSDVNVVPWKETNDNVGRIGGWRVYAKEAQEAGSARDMPPAPAGTSVPAGATKPMQDGRDGHKMH